MDHCTHPLYFHLKLLNLLGPYASLVALDFYRLVSRCFDFECHSIIISVVRII